MSQTIPAGVPPHPSLRRLRLGLAPRLLLSVGLLACVALGITLASDRLLREAQERVSEQLAVTERQIMVGQAQVHLLAFVREVERLPLPIAPAAQAEAQARAVAELRIVEGNLAQLEQALVLPINRQRIQLAKPLLERLRSLPQQVSALVEAGRHQDATALMLRNGADVSAMRQLLTEVEDSAIGMMRERAAALGALLGRGQFSMEIGAGLGILLAGGLALFVALRGVTGPLRRLAATAEALAANRIEDPTGGRERQDEIGAIARGLEALRLKAQQARALEAEAEAVARRAAEEREAARREVAELVERNIGAVSQALATSSREVQHSIGAIAAAADHTSVQAGSVAAGAGQATENVQTVAAAAEQLAASVSEITRQVTQAAAVAGRAVEETRVTDGVVASLTEAANRIGEVVKLISDIAGQTNLLALNATIEAARAGDAGKGFAVVASEVKSLASQTAKATDDIAAQIASIQAASNRAAQSIKGIGEVVTEIDHISSRIAAAVEEQGAATQEIARNVTEAARGTQEVSGNVVQVTRSVEETTAALQVLRRTGEGLSSQGETLQREITAVVTRLRSAA